MDKIIDAIKVKKEVDESKTMALWKKFQQGRSSYLIFLDNSKVVRDSIKKLNAIPLGQLNNDRRWRLQRMMVKDLHNVLSSGQNFIDHLKYTHNFNESVHEKMYSIFFRELRNYLVHNNAFNLVTRNEYKIDHAPKFYQAMEKSTFNKFVNNKASDLYKKVQLDLNKVLKRESKLLAELIDLSNFLDEKEMLFDFEPVLNQYIISLNAYYSKWVLLVLKQKVTLSNLKKFAEKMKLVQDHFPGNFSLSRLRYLRLAIYKRSKNNSLS